MKDNPRLTGDPTSVFGSIIPFQNQIVPAGELPTRIPQIGEESLAVVLSEILLAHAALGDGYVSPLPAAKGLVFSSAVSPEMHDRLRDAEKAFNAWFDNQLKEDREELERLEELVQATKRGRSRDNEYVVDPFGSGKDDQTKLKALREKLALQSNVTWREHHFHKAALLELLAKSACGAMTCIDEDGYRLASSLGSPRALLADLSLTSLCKGSADSSLIRSSATGGASINSLKGDYSPAFNYFCSAQHEDVETVGERIANCVSGRSARGKAIVIPVEVTNYPEPSVSTETLLLAMKAVYTKGRLRPEEKLQVTWESPEVAQAWKAFLNLPIEAYVSHTPSPADLATYKKMPATLRTIAQFASRAAQTAAILRSLETSPTASVVLCWNALSLAQEFARLIFLVSSGEKKMARRREGNAKAQASFKTHEKLMAAEQALLKAIQSSPDGKISRTAARNVEGLTLGLLDELVKMDKVVELRGSENIKMGKTTRAYVLKESVQMDAEEAVAELEAALEAFEPGTVADIGTTDTFRDLQKVALVNNTKYRVPAVPVTSMTSRQIAAIPTILREYENEVVLRGTRDCPEPEAVIEDGADGYPVTKDSICLWFRRQPDGTEFRESWAMSAILGLTSWDDGN